MCGRFIIDPDDEEMFFEHFGAEFHDQLTQRFNVAPTQEVPVIRADVSGRRGVAFLRWGLIPSWAKDRAIANKLVNARSETVTEKPSFRTAFRKRRCIVPATGYYEWHTQGTGRKAVKQPWLIRFKDHKPMGLAGLWESWNDPDDGVLETFTLMTTDSQGTLAEIHDRMPVILHPTDYDLWLDARIQEAANLQPLLRPYEPHAFELVRVSTRVNSPRSDEPSLIEPLSSE